jgi:hypothetical protein
MRTALRVARRVALCDRARERTHIGKLFSTRIETRVTLRVVPDEVKIGG